MRLPGGGVRVRRSALTTWLRRLEEYDDFWAGQITSVTRAGLARLYRPAGTFPWDTDGRGRPGKGQPLPSARREAARC